METSKSLLNSNNNNNNNNNNLYYGKREERKPTRCNNIDDLLSIVDVDY